jgi:hypothetical protein
MESTRPPDGQGGKSAELLDALEFDFTTPAYLQFCQNMDVQLTQLVALWQHLAAPCALRVGRGTLTSSRPHSRLA